MNGTSWSVSALAILAIVVTMCACDAAAQASGEASVFATAQEKRRAYGDQFMAQVLAEKAKKAEAAPLVYAMAALYTGKDIPGGNARLRAYLKEKAGGDEMSMAEASSEGIKWRMRGWTRVYYLFHDKSRFFPGRLEPDVQRSFEEMFFLFGSAKSSVHRADTKFVWYIGESENHDMMGIANAYLALQAVQHLDGYKDKKLPDGHTAAEHVRAWHTYFARYALERAKFGLFVELSPIYGKWFLGEFVNMYEFSESQLVRQRMEMLLHLIWADWSIDQLNGIRGGGKTRSYQDHYSQKGLSDSWNRMAMELMGVEPWFWNSHGGLSSVALRTSTYEPPDVVLDIALNRDDTSFVYRSTRPAKTSRSLGKMKGRRGYWMDGRGGKVVRYSFCTPDYVLGGWMLDSKANYAAIHHQNRWSGIIFDTGPNARVYPQSQGKAQGGRTTYAQHIGVQHRNVMLTAPHPKKGQFGPMRVYFPIGWRDKLIERDGWVILREGDTWLGVRTLSSAGNTADKRYTFKPGTGKRDTGGYWLWPAKNAQPVALVAGRAVDYASIEEFVAYLKGHTFTIANAQVAYTFAADTGAETRLELGGKLAVPRVNGKTVDLSPNKTFDSPYLQAEHGSGVVTIKKGERELTLDFNLE